MEEIEKSTTLLRMNNTGLLNDETVEVRYVEPLGMNPALVIIDCTEFSSAASSCKQEDSSWPPSRYMLTQAHNLILRCF
jgi:hypothetical protein